MYTIRKCEVHKTLCELNNLCFKEPQICLKELVYTFQGDNLPCQFNCLINSGKVINFQFATVFFQFAKVIISVSYIYE